MSVERIRYCIKNHRAFIAYVIVVIGAVLAVNQYNQIALNREHKINQAAIERDRQTQYTECQRVQILRDQANGTNFLIYDTFERVRQGQLRTAKTSKSASVRRAARLSADRSRKVTQQVLITGPTDCDQALNDPVGYKAPQPRFIHKGGGQVDAARRRSQAIVDAAKGLTVIPTPPVSPSGVDAPNG